jgi:hypothetical protein
MYRESATADLYRDFMSTRLNKAPAEVTTEERQVGKTSHLQLQFGSGWRTFQRTARVQGKLILPDEEAEAITYEWRDTYHEIPSGWNRCGEALAWMEAGESMTIDPGGLCRTVKDGILMPSGRVIRYPALRRAMVEDPNTGKLKDEWVYGVGRFTRRIYGPKVCANIVQSLARDIVAEDALAFFKETGYRWKGMTHDELIYCWPQESAHLLLAMLQEQMRTPRKWWPELVLWSEGGIGHRYSEAH